MKSIYFFCFSAVLLYPEHSAKIESVYQANGRSFGNDGNKGYNDVPAFIHFNPMLDSSRYVEVEVPMDLNLAMQKRGMFGDINLGVNTLSARWVSQQYWRVITGTSLFPKRH